MSKAKETLILGFALFAIFFGSGNLIFPPLIGLNTGSNWMIAAFGFLITAVGLPLLGVFAFTKKGSLEEFASEISPKFNTIFFSTLILVIGPLFVIPRTGAVTYELAVVPLLNSDTLIPTIISSVVFFTLTYLLTVKKSAITDILGQFLTPIILVILAAIFIRGFMVELAPAIETELNTNLFSYGFIQGYQTMDGLGSVLMGIVIINGLRGKGITDEKEQREYLYGAAIIACVSLGAIYGFLIFLGSSLSGLEQSAMAPAVVIAEITLGSIGRSIFGICAGAACLTTSVGLASLTADWFAKLTKISYEKLVLMICLLSSITAIGGLDMIITLAIPVLVFLYPVTTALILMNIFGLKPIYYKIVTYTVIVVAIIELLASTLKITMFANLLAMIPLASSGFAWVVPFAISLFVAFIVDKCIIKKVA